MLDQDMGEVQCCGLSKHHTDWLQIGWQPLTGHRASRHLLICSAGLSAHGREQHGLAMTLGLILPGGVSGLHCHHTGRLDEGQGEAAAVPHIHVCHRQGACLAGGDV